MNHALLVGINKYLDPCKAPTLKGCVNDATEMGAFLETVGFPNPTRLIDDEATTRAVIDALTAGVSQVHKNEELVFFYSGHGAHFPVHNGQEAICPADYDTTGKHVIVVDQLVAILSRLEAGARVTIFADCCYAGGLLGGRVLGKDETIRTIPVADMNTDALDASSELRTFDDALSELTGVNLVSACSVMEVAVERPLGNDNGVHGVMTYHLLQELRGNGVARAASETVAALRRRLSAFHQTPCLVGDSSLFDKPLIQKLMGPASPSLVSDLAAPNP